MKRRLPSVACPLGHPTEDYIHNLALVLPADEAAAWAAAKAGEDHVDERGYEYEDDADYERLQDDPTRVLTPLKPVTERVDAWMHNRTYGRSSDPPSPRPVREPGEPCADNLRLTAQILGLTDSEREVLLFFVACTCECELADLCVMFGRLPFGGVVRVVAQATRLSEEVVRAALHARGGLIVSGALERKDYNEIMRANQMFECLRGLTDLLLTPGLTRADFMSRYIPESAPTSLTLADYPHLANSVEDLRALLKTALTQGRRGVNVLLHGETGTGKTALARVLADALGVPLYSVTSEDEEGGPADARERLASLRLGQRMMAPGAGLLLFDELEDLLESGSEARSARLSKLWLNVVLEVNAVPTLWLANDLREADVALLRRFSYAVEFDALAIPQRDRVLRGYLGDHAGISAAERQQVAARFDVSPAQLGSGVQVARMIDPGFGSPTLERVIEPIAALVQGRQSPVTVFDPATYWPDSVNTTEDLQALANTLAGFRPGEGPGLSLCLYGVPGTGKSQFVRYLAHRMGRAVIYRHASDLLGPMHGQTEANIARAFRLAARQDAVLLFDEVDSFLRDRQQLTHAWEATGVNEFLQQLESHRGVVACTTNLLGHLDPAAMRRFVFKLELLPLTPEQSARHFVTVFAALLDAPLSDSACLQLPARLGSLTPGDMAVVARRLRALGARTSLLKVIGALKEEARLARPAVLSPAGFRAAGGPRVRLEGELGAAD